MDVRVEMGEEVVLESAITVEAGGTREIDEVTTESGRYEVLASVGSDAVRFDWTVSASEVRVDAHTIEISVEADGSLNVGLFAR